MMNIYALNLKGDLTVLKKKVFIDGSAGTTGLRIHERLASRKDIELITLDGDARKDLMCRKQAIDGADVAFLCLPDAAAKEIVGAVENENVKILDTSTAHRTNPDWAYGFPELSNELKEKILNSKRIAVPGCHASGFCSIVSPLVESGILPTDYPIACTSITGYSGGGKKMIADYEAPERSVLLDSPTQYALSQKHKHLPEMKAVCHLDYEPCFSPIVSDFYSGMAVSIPIFTRLISKKVTALDVQKMFEEHYSGARLISVLPFGYEGTIYANHLSGKDSMEIIISGNDERILISSRFDNLGKGASGAAIQCFNLITGADEAEGLEI